MANPMDSLKQLADQFGWASPVLGDDFWPNLLQSMKMSGAAITGRPAGQPAPAGPSPFHWAEAYLAGPEVVICLGLPGLSAPEHVAVSLVSPGEVLVEAYLQPELVAGITLMKERYSGYCARQISLPASVSGTAAQLSYEDGILEVRLPVAATVSGSGGIPVVHVSAPAPGS